VSAALEASGLGKRYRRTWALRDCNLTVPEGRIAALVGPNGAGKTTLLHLAVGLLAPTTGSISVLGQRPATPGCSPRSASWPRTPPCTATSPPPST
jgi:ABC-2 type transport system ATP-binding protein